MESAVRTMVSGGQDAYVVSGPLYESTFGTLPGADETHTIPSGYLKSLLPMLMVGWKPRHLLWSKVQLALMSFVHPR